MELVAIFVFWTLMAMLTAANIALDTHGLGAPRVLAAPRVLVAFAESYLWAVLTPFIFWVASRFTPDRRWLRPMLLLLGIGIVLAMLVDHIVAFLHVDLMPHPHRPPPHPGSGPRMGPIELWFLNDLLVYLAILAAGIAREYFLRYRARMEETTRLQAHAAQLQAQLAEARLDTLRTQLDPHFLFNTLNAVSALVERDPRGVRRMISRLSELLRHTLEGGREQEVPLRQEMQVIERYLEIMQIRFQGRLELDLRLDPAAADALVPSFILQPLVENAITHGIDQTTAAGRIEITATREGERVVLRVRDSGPAPAGAPAVEGVGLRNTRARLEQLYGEAQSLTLRPAEGGGMVAEVTLPFHTRGDLHVHGVSAGE